MAHEPIHKRAPAVGSEIPDKLYFRIGEVARLCEVPAYVLRFWESEFPPLRPNKGGTGQRLYRRRDVETALRIKRLLYDEGYTIPGARQILKAEQKQKEPQLSLLVESGTPPAAQEQLKRLKRDLQDLLTLLSKGPEKATVHAMRAPRSPRMAVAPAVATQTEKVSSERLFDFPSGSTNSATGDE